MGDKMFNLTNKVVLITGATGGIGGAIARKMKEAGATVVVSGRNTAKLDSEFDDSYVKIPCDLAQEGAAVELVMDAIEKCGRVDVLINNAGVFFFNEYCNTSLKRIELMLQLHVMTVAKLTRLFAADMKERRSGYILNMSSMSAWMAMPGIQTYNASKAFIYNFSKSLWYELKPYNVHITVMAPGAVDTGLFGLAPNLRKLAVALTVSIPPEKLVKRALKKLFKGKKADTPGFINWLSTPLLKHTPDWLLFLAMKYVGKYQK